MRGCTHTCGEMCTRYPTDDALEFAWSVQSGFPENQASLEAGRASERMHCRGMTVKDSKRWMLDTAQFLSFQSSSSSAIPVISVEQPAALLSPRSIPPVLLAVRPDFRRGKSLILPPPLPGLSRPISPSCNESPPPCTPSYPARLGLFRAAADETCDTASTCSDG